MTATSRNEAAVLTFRMPEDGNYLLLPDHETAYFLPTKVLQAVKQQGECRFNATHYQRVACTEQALGYPLLHLIDTIEGSEMWVLDHPHYPLIWRMKNNPLEVDWEVRSY